jgi:hypothetical protein
LVFSLQGVGRSSVAAPIFALAVCLSVSCTRAPASAVRPEPSSRKAARVVAAERLFRRDARFRGGDAAYSVALPGPAERRLWLFGDSFVVPPRASRSRSGSTLVRNCAAVQHGSDPRTASLRFAFGGTVVAPRALFAPTTRPQRGRWLWPGPPVRLPRGALLLSFFALERRGGGPFGFRAVRGEARLVDDARKPFAHWQTKSIALPTNRWGVLLGTGGALVDGPWLYAYPVVEPGDHTIYLLRWPLAAARRGELADPRWWDGAGFVAQRQLEAAGRRPSPIARGGQTELTVHRQRGRYLMVHSVGFPQGDLAVRRATRPEGPWSAPQLVYRPRGHGRRGVLIYAAKAHPGLGGAADRDTLLLTYATNHTDFAQLGSDLRLYYPHLVAVPLTALER